MKHAVTVQEQIAQALRVKEQAQQIFRVSTAFTEAGGTGRSAKRMYLIAQLRFKKHVGRDDQDR